MATYYGDFAEDDTINIPFNTFDSNDPSASVTITNLADSDIHVHKDGSITQAVTDGATIVINFDGITGNHMITIDTSADAFYATGSEYSVRIEGTTVDGATINAWVGSFSIERAGGALALIKLLDAKVASDHLLLESDHQATLDKVGSDHLLLDSDHAKTQSDVALLSTKMASDHLLLDSDHAKTQSDVALLSTKIDSDQVILISDLLLANLDLAISELAQTAPSATPSTRQAIMLPYMMIRDKFTSTATTKKVHNNAGTVIAKSTLSDDGTTFTDDEMVTGP